MPTVIQAAFVRPIITVALAAAVTASFIVAQPQSVAASAGPSCSGWKSLTQPPRTIRVLRLASGRVQTVSFRKYIVTVMGKEWPSYLPQAVVEAGAVAVKQYAWYHAVYSSRSSSGRCFDVKDGTGDQLYRPGKARIRPDHHHAVDATWNVTLRKNGRFFMTGYRRGDKVRCGRDATGYKLFARSAVQCARRGLGWREILRKYYGPSL
ncbi:MAG: SpoIID/LytB domain-containing protein, partial [Chloroflexota bacterium]